jgi:arginase
MLWRSVCELPDSSRFDPSSGRACAIKPLRVIGAAVGLGGRDEYCRQGPDHLRDCGLMTRLSDAAPPVSWAGTIRESRSDLGDGVVDRVAGFCDRLARAVYRVVRDGRRVCVLGGDHTCAIGTWSGVWQALAGRGPLGLVWVDAHMDSHTPATSPSGALHGMPLACLLGHGPAALSGLAGGKPKLAPQHVCLVGVRSFEFAEAALLRRLGVRVFTMDEVRRRGLARVMDDALARVRQNTAGFGISIDLDAVDPGDAPAVGSPVDAGIGGKELITFLARMGRLPGLLGLEIAEFNPHRDVDKRTAELVIGLLVAMVGLRG